MKTRLQKSFALLLALLFSAVLLAACSNASQNRNREIISVNHRGYSAEAPENTLAAFRLSKEKGFDVVETDVSFTKDGVPVLLHDKTVNRTSNGNGAIRNLTLEEVSALDFGSWKNAAYAGEKIPTLAQFLSLCRELELHPYLEIKSPSDKTDWAVLCQVVENSGVSCTFISFDVNALKYLAEVFPTGRFGLLCEVVTQNAVNSLLQLKTQENSVFIDANFRCVTNAQVNLCKKNGVPLELWTINGAREVANIHPYVSGVTSDSVHAQRLFKTI